MSLFERTITTAAGGNGVRVVRNGTDLIHLHILTPDAEGRSIAISLTDDQVDDIIIALDDAIKHAE